jgi:hypothetical protein
MTDPRDPEDAHAYTRGEVRESWVMRRRRKIREEIERNRRGEYKVPTWVLGLLLVAIVAGWILFIALA